VTESASARLANSSRVNNWSQVEEGIPFVSMRFTRIFLKNSPACDRPSCTAAYFTAAKPGTTPTTLAARRMRTRVCWKCA